eukprot:symbB.v1.2.004350.t2/scaffold240.1/size264318/6
MAFFASFSPVCCQPVAPEIQRLVLPSIVPLQRQVQCTDPKAESLVNNDTDAGHNSHGFSDSKDDASPSGHSWAWTRLQEHTWKELDAWKQGSEENRLKDALDALDAAFQALRLAEEICRDCLSSDVPNVARPSDRCQRVDFTVQQLPMPSPGESEQDAGFGYKSPAETENQSHGDSKVKESLPFHLDAESESERLTCQSTVGASRLSSELVQTDKAVQATVSGKLTVRSISYLWHEFPYSFFTRLLNLTMPTPALALDKKVTAERGLSTDLPFAAQMAPFQSSISSDRRRRLWRLGRAQSIEGSRFRDVARCAPWIEVDEVGAAEQFQASRSSEDCSGRKSHDFTQDSVILGAESESDDEPLWEMRSRRLTEEEAVKAATCALLYQSETMTASMVRRRSRKEPVIEGCWYESNGCWVPGTSRAKTFISI